MERNICAINTRDGGYTLSVNNILLHSGYYPAKAAKTFAEGNLDKIQHKKNIVVYGIGLGYHINEILKLIDINSNVFAFDIDDEIMKKSEELNTLKEIKKDNRIQLYLGYSKEVLIEFSEKMKLVDNIIVYKPSLKVLPEKYSDFIAVLNSFELAKIEMEKSGEKMLENYDLNTKMKCESIKTLFEKVNLKDKPVIIAAGGPSLEDGINWMGKYRDKVHIFALGRTIDTLAQNGIIPDIITIIDPNDIVYEQIKKHLDIGIPLCFLSTANNLAVRNYKGPKYIFFNDMDENNVDNTIINTGKSVSVAALDIAIKAGAKKIIFAGQDLAFVDNKFHAGNEDQAFKNYNKGLKKVTGVDGKTLHTTAGLMEFKRNIENIIKNNPSVTFINCSRGAKIMGTVEKDFGELL